MQSNQKALAREEAPILSALRYPGSKRRLAGYIQRTLELNKKRPKLFVEPFAGGASVALQLLANSTVERIGLADIDPLVAGFWKTVFSKTDCEWLVEQIEQVEVTIDQWSSFKTTVPTDTRTCALACLFLNRTSFSGILAPSGGPLGGRKQASKYEIDCRFPRATLVKRIRQAAELRDRVVFVEQFDWTKTLQHVFGLRDKGMIENDICFYFDPPFFEKADRLYTFFFHDQDHVLLRDSILNLVEPWILSYDAAEQVKVLYAGVDRVPSHVDLIYSIGSHSGNREVQEVVMTNLELSPTETRLWRRSEEWKTANSIKFEVENEQAVMEVNSQAGTDGRSATQGIAVGREQVDELVLSISG